MAINPFSSSVLGQMNPEVQDSESMLLGGLGLGGAAFAAQTGRLPSPTMPGPSSALAQQVAANDAARRSAARQAAAAARPIGSNLPANPASPAVGASGGARLPANPSLAQSQTAARQAAGRTTASLLGRSGSLLRDPRTLAFGGGFTLGSALDNAFDISGNIAQSFIPDEPTLTREERAALEPTEDSMIGTGRVSGLTQRDRSAPEQIIPSARLEQVIFNPLLGQTIGGEFVPEDPIIRDAPLGSAVQNQTTIAEDSSVVAPSVEPQAPETPVSNLLESVPTAPPVNLGVADTQELLLRRFGAPTISQIQELDRQDREARLPQGFIDESEAREQRLRDQAALRARFPGGVPVSSRLAAMETGTMTDAERRRFAKGLMRGASEEDIADSLEIANRYGLDPRTGQPTPEPDQPTQLEQETAEARLRLINAQIEAAGKKDPDKLARVTAEADRLISAKPPIIPKEARQAYILGQMGADVDTILGAGITSTPKTFSTAEEAEAANLPKGTEVIINGRRAVIE
jgi:hypothetical protein